MDSGSSAGERSSKRRKRNCNNVDNVQESVEEVPKILSPEIHDVFHVFANMLDVRSFLKLAMASKKMYKRCMGDKQIEINVDLHSLDVTNTNGTVDFELFLLGVFHRYRNEYVAALRKLPCKVSIKLITTSCETNSFLSISRKYLKEIGVNRIEELMLYFDKDFTDSEAVASFIKEFNVRFLLINDSVADNALLLMIRTFLQLNMKKLCLDAEVPIDYILEIESSIPELSFPEVHNISKEELDVILSKIHSGSLRCLTVATDAINWDNYEKLPFDHKGPLPDDRPLLFARNDTTIGEYWFLHWHGGVTKFVREEHDFDEATLKIFKCEPWELPCALRKNEDILNALAEKRPRVCCSAEQFSNFTLGFKMLDPTHNGPLPADRPLYCNVKEHRFWMLDESENLIECCWAEGSATWESFNSHKPKVIDHPALKKHMFWKVLEQVKEWQLRYFCEELNEFDSWFEDFEKLDFEYSGALPNTRPLVFKGNKKQSRVVLLDDRIVECIFNADTVKSHICYCLDCPPALFTARILVEMLKDPDHKSMNFNISFDVFRDGLEQLKKSYMVLQKRILIAEKTETDFWYRNAGVVWNVEWKDGRISISKRHLRESPSIFLKQVFRCLVEERSKYSLTLELEQFRECLELFTIVPFDYSGPLRNESPLAFVKNVIRHTCRHHTTCQCSEVSSVHVWFVLEDGLRLTVCSWGKIGRKMVEFTPPTTRLMEMPAILQSTEYIKKSITGKI